MAEHKVFEGDISPNQFFCLVNKTTHKEAMKRSLKMADDLQLLTSSAWEELSSSMLHINNIQTQSGSEIQFNT